MKKSNLILISSLMISFSTFATNFSYGNLLDNQKAPQVLCFKVGTDGSGSKVGTDGSGEKVGTDGSGEKVGTDGSGEKSICQIISTNDIFAPRSGFNYLR